MSPDDAILRRYSRQFAEARDHFDKLPAADQEIYRAEIAASIARRQPYRREK